MLKYNSKTYNRILDNKQYNYNFDIEFIYIPSTTSQTFPLKEIVKSNRSFMSYNITTNKFIKSRLWSTTSVVARTYAVFNKTNRLIHYSTEYNHLLLEVKLPKEIDYVIIYNSYLINGDRFTLPLHKYILLSSQIRSILHLININDMHKFTDTDSNIGKYSLYIDGTNANIYRRIPYHIIKLEYENLRQYFYGIVDKFGRKNGEDDVFSLTFINPNLLFLIDFEHMLALLNYSYTTIYNKDNDGKIHHTFNVSSNNDGKRYYIKNSIFRNIGDDVSVLSTRHDMHINKPIYNYVLRNNLFPTFYIMELNSDIGGYIHTVDTDNHVNNIILDDGTLMSTEVDKDMIYIKNLIRR